MAQLERQPYPVRHMVQLCPACHRPNPRLLDASKIAVVNFYACGGCLHVWTASKTTGEVVANITPIMPIDEEPPVET